MSSRDFQETSRETLQKKKERKREKDIEKKTTWKTSKTSPTRSIEPMGPIKYFAT